MLFDEALPPLPSCPTKHRKMHERARGGARGDGGSVAGTATNTEERVAAETHGGATAVHGEQQEPSGLRRTTGRINMSSTALGKCKQRRTGAHEAGAVGAHGHAADPATERGDVERGDMRIQAGGACTLGKASARHSSSRLVPIHFEAVSHSCSATVQRTRRTRDTRHTACESSGWHSLFLALVLNMIKSFIALSLGISSHSEDQRENATRSGKQRKIVRY